MTDTTNTEPPLPEPTYAVTVNGVRVLTFTDDQMREYGDARAAHAVAQMQGEPVATPGEVLVTVSGLTGSGKSAIAGEIEIMCKALGLDVLWTDGHSEKNLTGADWTQALELYKPKGPHCRNERLASCEITDAEIDALLLSELGFDPRPTLGFTVRRLRYIVRAAIALANGRGRNMSAHRKKPVVIEAVQWFKLGDHQAVREYQTYDPEMKAYGWIETLEGGHIVTPGDWIITGVKGEHYPCKPDIFAMTYEIVEE